jgi:hypothetical protein
LRYELPDKTLSADLCGGQEMGEAPVIGALRAKRAELSGQIADLEKRAAQCRADLMHVDAVLRLFAPDTDVTAIAPKAVRRRNPWFAPGELSRTILDILRTAPEPLTVRDITARLMARYGLAAGDVRAFGLVRKLVMNALTRQATTLAERVRDGRAVFWRVAA